MSRTKMTIAAGVTLALFAVVGTCGQDTGVGDPVPQDFSIDLYTIDGGGKMWDIGSGYELSGTIGQPATKELATSDGTYTLTGGFWAASAM